MQGQEVCVCVEKCVYVWNPNFTKNFLGFWFIFVRGCFLYRGGWGLRLEAYKKKGGLSFPRIPRDLCGLVYIRAGGVPFL